MSGLMPVGMSTPGPRKHETADHRGWANHHETPCISRVATVNALSLCSQVSTSTTLWQQAISFAAWKHRHQMRKDGRTPYIAHPFRVAMTVREVFGCDDPVAICGALLHDTIEDTLTDYEDIAENFGTQIADVVAAVTKNMALPELQRETDYDTRLASADWRARLVKLGDVFDNFSDLSSVSIAERERMSDVPDKCRHAIELAKDDADHHEPARRAVAAVTALLEHR